MSPIKRLDAWWCLRNARERQMLVLMGISLAAFVWWFGLLLPLQSWRKQSQVRYDRAAAEWIAVRDTTAAIRALQAGSPRDAASLATDVLGSAKDHGVAISRRRQNAQGAMVVGIDAVDSPQLLGWLAALQQERQVMVETAVVEKSDGRVRAELAFGITTGAAAP